MEHLLKPMDGAKKLACTVVTAKAQLDAYDGLSFQFGQRALRDRQEL
jgi:hypothetical protein